MQTLLSVSGPSTPCPGPMQGGVGAAGAPCPERSMDCQNWLLEGDTKLTVEGVIFWAHEIAIKVNYPK